MNTMEEKLNTKLYEKMFAEQEAYREWLLSQPSEEVLNHTYEYTVREDILLSLEYHSLPVQQARAMLKLKAPLAEVFKDFEKRETDYMDVVWDTLESRANKTMERALMQKKKLSEPER